MSDKSIFAKYRFDIEGFARDLLGIKLHPGQVRYARKVLARGVDGWRPAFHTIALSSGNRAGKTMVLAIVIMHSCIFKLGMKPPMDSEKDRRRWQKAAYMWFHFAIQQEIAELVYTEITNILQGTHVAQKNNGCPLSEMMPSVAVWDKKFNGDYRWIVFDARLGGAEIHFRTTAEKGVGTLGRDMHGISFDEAGLERNLTWIVNNVMHLRRLGTGGQLLLVSTPEEGLCVGVETPVLTDDLRWVPAGSLAPGDGLWAFTDERSASGRRVWTKSEVVDNWPSFHETITLTLASGNMVTCTPDHRWLAQRLVGVGEGTNRTTEWVMSRDLRVGDGLPRYLNVWDVDDSHDGGWLAGMLDGEGWLSVNNDGAQTGRLGVAQNEGLVAVRFRETMRRLGLPFSETTRQDGPIVSFSFKGGISGVAEALGRLRPARLLPKFRAGAGLQSGTVDHIVAIETGSSLIANLTTTSGTYFAGGYGAHNTEFADFWFMGDEDSPDRRRGRMSVRMSTRDNVGYGIDQKTFDELVADMDADHIRQNIDGFFIQGRTAYFNAQSVDNAFDDELPERESARKNSFYIQGVDPALRLDSTWSIVVQAIVLPEDQATGEITLFGVRAERLRGKQTTPAIVGLAMDAHNAYDVARLNSQCSTALDATGFGGKMFREALEKEIPTVRSIEFGGSLQKKRKLLGDLRTMLDSGRLIMPRVGVWLAVRRQLLGYKLDDRAIEQDAVMALACIVAEVKRTPTGDSGVVVAFDAFAVDAPPAMLEWTKQPYRRSPRA